MKSIPYWILLIIISVSACKSRKKLVKEEPLSEVQSMPACIKEKIAEFSKLGEKYRPKFIMRYNYKGKTVYYIPARCCDVPAEVIDENCNVICRPEGGITGKGDGKCPGFKTEATEGKVIWEEGQ